MQLTAILISLNYDLQEDLRHIDLIIKLTMTYSHDIIHSTTLHYMTLLHK